MLALAIAAAFGAGWLGSLLAIWVGPSLGFLDRPDDPDLKAHDRPAVPLGGTAIFGATILGWWIGGEVDWALVAMAAAVLILGLIDDRMDLSPSVRLMAELAIAGATVALGLVPSGLDSPFEAIVAVGLVVVAINAVNLFDGLDGLAGSSALIAFLGIGILAQNRELDPVFGLVMAGAMGGFLILNWPPARVFLGDNGSYFVGFALAISILRVSPDGAGSSLAVAGLVMGVFVLDLLVTVLRRRLSGRPMFSGDRQHLYDRLHARGWGIPKVVVSAALIQLAFVASALVLDRTNPTAGVILGVVGAALAGVVALAATAGRLPPPTSG